MIRLSREIRFPLASANHSSIEGAGNSWAGKPATRQLVPRLKLSCEIEGQPDPVTGYLCNIVHVDRLLRMAVEAVLNRATSASESTNTIFAEPFLMAVGQECREKWRHDARIAGLTLEITPWLRYQMSMTDDNISRQRPRLSVTEQFEFSAAHRLYCKELSQQENRQTFGKCSNPEGHGHNYVVDVTVGNQVASETGQVIDLELLEAVVNRNVIDVLDHKHLNRDIAYFADVNPSVENIAIAIFDWLKGQFGDATLECVRVYETPKTWAETRGGGTPGL